MENKYIIQKTMYGFNYWLKGAGIWTGIKEQALKMDENIACHNARTLRKRLGSWQNVTVVLVKKSELKLSS